MLQEGHEVGGPPLHLLQTLELAVLLLCVLRVRMGVRWGGQKGGFGLDPFPTHTVSGVYTVRVVARAGVGGKG